MRKTQPFFVMIFAIVALACFSQSAIAYEKVTTPPKADHRERRITGTRYIELTVTTGPEETPVPGLGLLGTFKKTDKNGFVRFRVRTGPDNGTIDIILTHPSWAKYQWKRTISWPDRAEQGRVRKVHWNLYHDSKAKVFVEPDTGKIHVCPGRSCKWHPDFEPPAIWNRQFEITVMSKPTRTPVPGMIVQVEGGSRVTDVFGKTYFKAPRTQEQYTFVVVDPDLPMLAWEKSFNWRDERHGPRRKEITIWIP